VDDILETRRFARTWNKLSNSRDSRFFSAQVFLKGLSTEAQHHIADLKLRFTKQIAFALADQESSQVRDLLIDSHPNLGLKQFRFAFLFLTEKVPGHWCFLSGANSVRSRKIASSVQKFYQLFSCSHVDTRAPSKGKLVIWLIGYNAQLFERIAGYGYHGIQVHYANKWFSKVPKQALNDGTSLGKDSPRGGHR